MCYPTKAYALREQGAGQNKNNFSKLKHTPFASRLKAQMFLILWGALI